MTGVVGALLAVALLAYRPLVVRMARSNDPEPTADVEEVALLARLRLPLSLLAALAGWTVLGGLAGLALGGVAGVVGWRTLSAVEAPAVARRRKELERDLPVAVHLLGAALTAGAATVTAVDVVAEALPGAVADELGRIHRRLALGVDPLLVWSELDGSLRPLGRCLARAHDSGTSVVTAVERLAEGLRADGRARRDALARTVEVRSAAPLGLCLLPAFLLLGVVPMVAGLLSSVSPFG